MLNPYWTLINHLNLNCLSITERPFNPHHPEISHHLRNIGHQSPLISNAHLWISKAYQITTATFVKYWPWPTTFSHCKKKYLTRINHCHLSKQIVHKSNVDSGNKFPGLANNMVGLVDEWWWKQHWTNKYIKQNHLILNRDDRCPSCIFLHEWPYELCYFDCHPDITGLSKLCCTAGDGNVALGTVSLFFWGGQGLKVNRLCIRLF